MVAPNSRDRRIIKRLTLKDTSGRRRRREELFAESHRCPGRVNQCYELAPTQWWERRKPQG